MKVSTTRVSGWVQEGLIDLSAHADGTESMAN